MLAVLVRLPKGAAEAAILPSESLVFAMLIGIEPAEQRNE